MKTTTLKSIIIITASVLFNLPSFAGTPLSTTKKTTEETAIQIKDQLHLKNSDIEQLNGKTINVVFALNESKNIDLVIVNTLNKDIQKQIEEQLINLNLQELAANQVYQINLNFKLIK